VNQVAEFDAEFAKMRNARMEREGLTAASEPEPPKQPEWPTIDDTASRPCRRFC
jgi:capsular polysaccharide biosynthesis protein